MSQNKNSPHLFKTPMFSFFKQRKNESGAILPFVPPFIPQRERIEELSFSTVFEDIGDPLQFAEHDTALKFWLPKAANETIRDIARRQGHSQSEAFRQLLFTHCYGLYAFVMLVDLKKDIFRDESSNIFFSRKRDDDVPVGKKRVTTYWVQELGKNVIPVKLWISRRNRDDLQLLADHAGIKLSQYIREIVISRLLGHGTLPKRPQMMHAVPLPAAEDWCEDIDVPWLEVSETEYELADLRMSRDNLIDNETPCNEKI